MSTTLKTGERGSRRTAERPPRRWLAPWLAAAVWLAAGGAQASGEGCPRFESASEGLPTVGEWRTYPDLGDVNGDGRLDVAAYPRKERGPGVWLVDRKLEWTAASGGLVVPGFSCGVGVDLADVNGDGHLDLGVADHCQGLFVFLGDGGKSWRLSASVLERDRRGYEHLQFGDLDKDGHRDLVAIGSFRGGLAVFRGDGKGNFRPRPPEETGLPDFGRGSDLYLGDVNGDGILDLAAAYSGAGGRRPPPGLHRNYVWLGDSEGRFRPAATKLFRDGRAFGVALGDVNGDGHGDLAVTRDRGRPLQVYLWSPEVDAGWLPALEGLPGEGTARLQDVEITDITGDGHADLVATDHRRSGIRVWRGDGTGAWQECEDTGLPRGREEVLGWGLAVGDVDRDGRSDIAAGFGRNAEGSLEVWVQRP
jgi:hypothetical protein